MSAGGGPSFSGYWDVAESGCWSRLCRVMTAQYHACRHSVASTRSCDTAVGRCGERLEVCAAGAGRCVYGCSTRSAGHHAIQLAVSRFLVGWGGVGWNLGGVGSGGVLIERMRRTWLGQVRTGKCASPISSASAAFDLTRIRSKSVETC